MDTTKNVLAHLPRPKRLLKTFADTFDTFALARARCAKQALRPVGLEVATT